MSRQLLLASQSPQRLQLMKTLGVVFEVVPAHLDERAITDVDLRRRAAKVALAKAQAVAARRPEAVIIAADTYLIQNDQALEKPLDIAEAKAMLRQLSGNTALEVTGVAYLDPDLQLEVSKVVEVSLTFRELSETEITQYCETQPVTTWSAAFCPAYPEGAALIASIDGSFTSFTHGFPVEVIVPLLRQSKLL